MPYRCSNTRQHANKHPAPPIHSRAVATHPPTPPNMKVSRPFLPCSIAHRTAPTYGIRNCYLTLPSPRPPPPRCSRTQQPSHTSHTLYPSFFSAWQRTLTHAYTYLGDISCPHRLISPTSIVAVQTPPACHARNLLNIELDPVRDTACTSTATGALQGGFPVRGVCGRWRCERGWLELDNAGEIG